MSMALAAALLVALDVPPSPIRDDEDVVFYPTYGRQIAGGTRWALVVHGRIFEPEGDSLKRAAALGLMWRLLGLSREQAETARFKQRARAFLVDNERGKAMAIRLGETIHPAGTSGPDGHFAATIELPGDEVERLRAAAPGDGDWIAFEAVTRPGDRRRFAGRVRRIGPEGLSVISDVDDTIKVTEVHDRAALLANTFLREFRPVEGMAEVYRSWARSGAVFHYVSASPWQLYGPLSEFVETQGFPAGTFHLKPFRLKDASAIEFVTSQQDHKNGAIEGILRDFPRRRFVLVGDSGEQDPEVYGAVARRHPSQIVRILIRRAPGPARAPDRFERAFAGVPKDKWSVFDDPDPLCREALTPGGGAFIDSSPP